MIKLRRDLKSQIAQTAMPPGVDVLADLVARHIAGLVMPITSTPGVVDLDLVADHTRILEAAYRRVLELFADVDPVWCLEAAYDARATELQGGILDRVYRKRPALLALIENAGRL